MKFIKLGETVKDGKNCKLTKVLVETPLRSIRVSPAKDGKGMGYQLPSGSYKAADGTMKYSHPLFPADAVAMQKAVADVVENGVGGTFYPVENVDGLMGYVALETAMVWVDVTLTNNGSLLFPDAWKKDKDGKEEQKMLIPVKKDDPVRAEIIAAITAKVTA